MYSMSTIYSKMESRSVSFYLFTILILINQIKANFFVQTLDCSEDLKLVEKYMKMNNEEQVMSQSYDSPNNNYYQPNCDNALALIGKNNYQFHVEILRINIQPPTGEGICIDYLQLYDAPRVDNAMLLTPLEGLCGASLPIKRAFKTSGNYLTIRFKTGYSMNSFKYEGFAISVTQYPWSNSGNSKLVGFNPGGWNDGLSSSFQWTWNLQIRVPGIHRRPGQSMEKSPNGIGCIECNGCSLHQFDLDRDAYTVSTGCFMCVKIWNADYISAQRSCYSERQYISLLRSFGDPSIDFSTRDGLYRQIGCHQYYNNYGSKLDYCFCNEEKCNTAISVTKSLSVWTLLLISGLLKLLL